MFFTNKDVTERDIKVDENKMKQFLKYIGLQQGGGTKSNQSKLIRRLFASIGEPSSQVISIPTSSEVEIYRADTSDYEKGAVEEEEEEEEETVYETEASGLIKVNPDSLIERLELLILETKAGQGRLYDEM